MPLKSILNHVESLKSFVSTRESVVITAGRSTEIKVAAATRIRKTPLPRPVTDYLGEAAGAGGGGVSRRVPQLRRRPPHFIDDMHNKLLSYT